MIDWDRVNEMRNEIGEADFGTILELFLDEIETITFRLSQDDAARMETDFHYLKGCARNLGFRALARLCEEFEGLVIAGRGAELDLRHVLDSYATSKQIFIHALAEQRGRLPQTSHGNSPSVQIRNSAKI